MRARNHAPPRRVRLRGILPAPDDPDPPVPHRSLCTVLLAATLVACGPAVDGSPDAGAAAPTPDGTPAPGTSPTDDVSATPTWTAAEQEAIDRFGLQRAEPTLLAARRYAAACPDGDFDVIPTYEEPPPGVIVEYGEPEVVQWHALAYADLFVAFSAGELELRPVEGLGPDGQDELVDRPFFTFTVDDVVHAQPGTGVDAVEAGDRLTISIPWVQPCDVPSSGHVGLSVWSADEEVDGSANLVLGPTGRPSPVSRWLAAAAFEDLAAFAGRDPDIGLYLELHDMAGETSALFRDAGCWPEDGTCPTTTGLLGEWLLARGHQRDPALGSLAAEQEAAAADDALAAWLALPWQQRPLSDMEVDLPDGAADALGVTWTFREAQLDGAEVAALGVDWLGLRFPDVGVTCCTFVDTVGLQGVASLGPRDGPVELVGGTGDASDADRADPDVLYRWDAWPGGEIIRLVVRDGEVVGP